MFREATLYQINIITIVKILEGQDEDYAAMGGGFVPLSWWT